MATTKIIKLDDLSIANSYPDTPQIFGGPWGDSETHKHIEVIGMDESCVEAYDAPAEATREGVKFTADNVGEGGNSILLSFDGSDDVDAVLSTWNAANPSNTVTHNGAGTEVLTAGSAILADGGIQLREVQALLDAKVQKGRDDKLALLRSMRDDKCVEADHELNKHSDADPSKIDTEANWKIYRIALRDVTDSYKDGSGDGTSALDAFADDMSDFSGWPTKPS